MAARVYATYDGNFAARCLEAAEKAWAWLERHPEFPGFRNPPEIATGEYGDGQDSDERYWAASELFRTTGAKKYHEAFRALAATGSFDPYELGWADMGGYGMLAYLLSERAPDADLDARLRQGWMNRAAEIATTASASGYGAALRPEQYKWGSNMLVLEPCDVPADRGQAGRHCGP